MLNQTGNAGLNGGGVWTAGGNAHITVGVAECLGPRGVHPKGSSPRQGRVPMCRPSIHLLTAHVIRPVVTSQPLGHPSRGLAGVTLTLRCTDFCACRPSRPLFALAVRRDIDRGIWRLRSSASCH